MKKERINRIIWVTVKEQIYITVLLSINKRDIKKAITGKQRRVK